MRPARNSSDNVPALRRALEVLRQLRGEATARELHEALGVHRASIYRILRVLGDAGLVSQDAFSGKYRLGHELMILGFTARAGSPLVAAAQPLLQELAAATHQMSELAVPISHWQLMILDTWQAEGTPVRIIARPGLLMDLSHQTAHGLCYLAFEGTRRLTEYVALAQTGAGRATVNVSAPPPAGLAERCAAWKKKGFAWLRTTGLRQNGRVAVPVYQARARAPRLLATLAVACAGAELTPLRAEQWGAILRSKARALEDVLAKT